jgi:hypothetical protein
MAIDTKEALDKKILEQDGEIAALKAKAEGSEKLHEEMEALKKEAKDTREKLAEVTSKNWVEKYSTQNTKKRNCTGSASTSRPSPRRTRRGLRSSVMVESISTRTPSRTTGRASTRCRRLTLELLCTPMRRPVRTLSPLNTPPR